MLIFTKECYPDLLEISRNVSQTKTVSGFDRSYVTILDLSEISHGGIFKGP